MGRAIDQVVSEVADRGFTRLVTTLPEFRALVSAFGEAVAVRQGGPFADQLTPTARRDAAPRSLSAVHGLSAFPFHTDAAHHRVPPKYILMRLANGAISGTPTLLVDGRSPLHFVDRKTLTRETWLVHGGLRDTFYAPILDSTQKFLRFDSGCMKHPAGTSPKGDAILKARLAAAPIIRIDWTDKTTLVVDNWRMLHARGIVKPSDTRRCLLRVLVK